MENFFNFSPFIETTRQQKQYLSKTQNFLNDVQSMKEGLIKN